MPYQSEFECDVPEAPSASHPPVRTPALALIFYGTDLLLKHEIVPTAQGYALGAGKLLTSTDQQAIAEYCNVQALHFTEANTLCVGPHCLAFYLPPGKRPLYFDAKYQETASVAQLNGQSVPHPGLVFLAKANALSVYAVRGNARPESDTPLHHAPFWNMFTSGQMCRGSVRYPSTLAPSAHAEWTSCFFESLFTGPSRTDQYMQWGQSYEELLRHALTLDAFPEEVLMPAGLTLGALFARP